MTFLSNLWRGMLDSGRQFIPTLFLASYSNSSLAKGSCSTFSLCNSSGERSVLATLKELSSLVMQCSYSLSQVREIYPPDSSLTGSCKSLYARFIGTTWDSKGNHKNFICC